MGLKYFIGLKIDKSFRNSQFFAKGYRMVRRDRNMNGGVLIYAGKKHF